MKIIHNPSTSAPDVARIIVQDPSLAAKVVRLANSAFYGMPRSITSISNAVVILGLHVINTLVLSLTVFDLFPQDKENTMFNRQAFWHHSLGCALLAKLLAIKAQHRVMIDGEEAFCAGLLHDIGKIVMEQYLHEEFRDALALATRKHLTAHAAEQEAIGATHTEVAGWLTEEWDLPPVLQLPMRFHHSPAETENEQEAVYLIHLADRLCYDNGLALDETTSVPDCEPGIIAHFGLSAEDLAEVAATLPDELQKMETFFEMATGSAHAGHL